ncbi:RNA-binding S4 domain-containing protein [Streptomyces sp. NPDC090108]|uniref:RNA-binding S4 domain-containing protein n=1 Tax=Streptomyces sp. NPDC090108 TaxID=3365947 RepID=UPI0038045445
MALASEGVDDDGHRHTGGPGGAGAPRTGAASTAGPHPGAQADPRPGERDGSGPDGGPLDAQVAAATAAAVAAGPAAGESVRIDSWIWAVRLIKTRSQGATACRGGHVHVNGERVKPAYSVRVGDEVRVRSEGRERVVIVKRLIRKRVGAPVAVQCYIDNSPPPPPRESVAPAGLRDPGTGRPTKRDRRELERLRGPAGLGTLGTAGGTGEHGGSGRRSGSGGTGRSGRPDSRGR